jgi:hypothetical protein
MGVAELFIICTSSCTLLTLPLHFQLAAMSFLLPALPSCFAYPDSIGAASTAFEAKRTNATRFFAKRLRHPPSTRSGAQPARTAANQKMAESKVSWDV